MRRCWNVVSRGQRYPWLFVYILDLFQGRVELRMYVLYSILVPRVGIPNSVLDAMANAFHLVCT